MKSNKLSLITFTCGVLLAMPNLTAQTVGWGGSGSVNPLSYYSNGTVDNASLTWELGWFSDGYAPTADSFSTWATNWNSVDVGEHRLYPTPEPPTWNLNEEYTNLAPASAPNGKQIYMFAHNGGTTDKSVWGPLMGTAAGEALIITDGQFFPPLGLALSFDIADNPYGTEDDNFNVVFGRVDRNMYLDALWPTDANMIPANGGVIQGGGVFSNPRADSQAAPYDDFNGTFESQTGTWAPIPEPSAAILGCLGMLGLLRRRRPSH